MVASPRGRCQHSLAKFTEGESDAVAQLDAEIFVRLHPRHGDSIDRQLRLRKRAAGVARTTEAHQSALRVVDLESPLTRIVLHCLHQDLQAFLVIAQQDDIVGIEERAESIHASFINRCTATLLLLEQSSEVVDKK